MAHRSNAATTRNDSACDALPTVELLPGPQIAPGGVAWREDPFAVAGRRRVRFTPKPALNGGRAGPVLRAFAWFVLGAFMCFSLLAWAMSGSSASQVEGARVPSDTTAAPGTLPLISPAPVGVAPVSEPTAVPPVPALALGAVATPPRTARWKGAPKLGSSTSPAKAVPVSAFDEPLAPPE